jgi:hypothetical protein
LKETNVKRLLRFCTVAGLLLGIPLSHLVWSAPPAGRKTTVCHVSRDEGTAFAIRVANQAVPAHLRHGDCVLEEGQECLYDDLEQVAVCLTPEPEPEP